MIFDRVFRVASHREAVSVVTGENVTLEYAALNPLTTVVRNVTRDPLTDEEAVVRPVNAPETEVPQDALK